MIGAEDGLASEETPEDGDAGIQKWNRECDQGRGHAQGGGGFLAPENAVTTQKEADKKAARVAQENGGWIEVEAQNAQQSSSKRNGGNRQSNIVLEKSGYQSGRGGEETDSRG